MHRHAAASLHHHGNRAQGDLHWPFLASAGFWKGWGGGGGGRGMFWVGGGRSSGLVGKEMEAKLKLVV